MTKKISKNDEKEEFVTLCVNFEQLCNLSGLSAAQLPTYLKSLQADGLIETFKISKKNATVKITISKEIEFQLFTETELIESVYEPKEFN